MRACVTAGLDPSAHAKQTQTSLLSVPRFVNFCFGALFSHVFGSFRKPFKRTDCASFSTSASSLPSPVLMSISHKEAAETCTSSVSRISARVAGHRRGLSLTAHRKTCVLMSKSHGPCAAFTQNASIIPDHASLDCGRVLWRVWIICAQQTPPSRHS